MDQKKIIVIGLVTVGMVILLCGCIVVYKNGASKGFYLTQKRMTWHEGLVECTRLKKQMVKVMNNTDYKTLLTFLTKQKLRELPQIWLSSISMGKHTQFVGDFVDIYSGQAAVEEDLKTNHTLAVTPGGGNCLGAQFLTEKLLYLNAECGAKRFVICGPS